MMGTKQCSIHLKPLPIGLDEGLRIAAKRVMIDQEPLSPNGAISLIL